MINEKDEKWASVKDFFSNPILITMLIMSVTILLVTVACLAYFIGFSDRTIILHYNVYLGVDLVGSWWQIYLMPLTGFVILLINLMLAWGFYFRKERIASHILMLTSAIVQSGVAIAALSAIVVNY